MTAWLAQDPEILRAALEIVDTWDEPEALGSPLWTGSCDSGTDDMECASSTSSESPTNSSSPRLPPLVVKPPRVQKSGPRQLQPSTLTSTHHRRREEIQYLRVKVVELEQELQTLERRKRGRCENVASSVKTDHVHSGLWRDIALRQQRLRTVSETEQAKLRERIDAQKKVARGLLKLMQQARRLEDDETMQAIKRQRIVSTDPELICKMDQLMCIDEMHMKMDLTFAVASVHDRLNKSANIKLLEDRPGQFVIELAAAWTVPFAQERAMEALWRYSNNRYVDKACAPEFDTDAKIRADEDELVAHFSAVAKIGASTGNFTGQAIVKRFSEHGTSRPAIIFNSFFRPSTSSPGDFSGVMNREESCIRVVPAAMGLPQHGSRVQFVQTFTVSFSDEVNGRYQAGVLTNLMLDKLRDCLDVMHETIETLLLTPAV